MDENTNPTDDNTDLNDLPVNEENDELQEAVAEEGTDDAGGDADADGGSDESAGDEDSDDPLV